MNGEHFCSCSHTWAKHRQRLPHQLVCTVADKAGTTCPCEWSRSDPLGQLLAQQRADRLAVA